MDQAPSAISFNGNQVQRILLPPALGVLFLSGLFVLLPPTEFFLLGGLLLIYLIPPAGKEVVIPMAIGLGVPWWIVAPSVALVDILIALFVVRNFPIAERIPLLGDWIRRFIQGGTTLLSEHPWLDRLYFAGLVFFVMIPFQGSGGVGGSIVGRMLGMTEREVMAAITLGALFGCFLIALGSTIVCILLPDGLIPAAGMVILGLFLVGALVVYFQSKKRPSD